VDVERYGRLLADLTPREARLALVVDQAEELFTSDNLNRRPELRNDFAIALNALAEKRPRLCARNAAKRFLFSDPTATRVC
jgi:hypothetical protein